MADQYNETLEEWLAKKLSLSAQDDGTTSTTTTDDDDHRNGRGARDTRKGSDDDDPTPDDDASSLLDARRQEDGQRTSHSEGQAGPSHAENELPFLGVLPRSTAESASDDGPTEARPSTDPEGQTPDDDKATDRLAASEPDSGRTDRGSAAGRSGAVPRSGKKLTRKHSLWQRLQSIVRSKPKSTTSPAPGHRPDDDRRLDAENDERQRTNPEARIHVNIPRPNQTATRTALHLNLAEGSGLKRLPASGVMPENSRPQISPTSFDRLPFPADPSPTRRARPLPATSRWRKLRGSVQELAGSATSRDAARHGDLTHKPECGRPNDNNDVTRNPDRRPTEGRDTLRIDDERTEPGRQRGEMPCLGQGDHVWDKVGESDGEEIQPKCRRRSQSIGTLSVPKSLHFDRADATRSSFVDGAQESSESRQDRGKTLLSRLALRQPKPQNSIRKGHQRTSSDPPDVVDKGVPLERGCHQRKVKYPTIGGRAGALSVSLADLSSDVTTDRRQEMPQAVGHKVANKMSVCDFEHDTKDAILIKRQAGLASSLWLPPASSQKSSGHPTEPSGGESKDERGTMFGRKSHGDVKKSANKVLDQKKDTVTRLKHLRVVLETYDVEESKNFFDQHYSYIYYIFHDHFTTVEADLKQRASKQHREELDFVLYVLEKILTLLPDLIHKRWQYHSIGRIMKKLLHPGNSIKVQREGMRLFLIWYQILMDNATEECHATYRSLVPQLGSSEGLGVDMFTVRTPSSSKVQPVEICPILPPLAGEEPHDNLARTLLKFLLKYMVEEVMKIQWSSSDMYIYSFNFLFNKYKEYYLKNIFPEFKDISLYEPCTELPERRLWHPATEAARGTVLAMCQEAVVEWFTKMLNIKKTKPSTSPPDPQDKPPEDSVDHTVVAMDGNPDGLPGSNTSTLSMGSSEHDSTGSEHGSEEHSTAEHEIVCHVLYSSRENIDILHEVFRQAFLFPFQEGSSEAIRRVIHMYTDWFKIVEEKDRPIFMQESTSADLHSPGLPRSESSPLIQNGGNSLNSCFKSQPHLPEAVSVGNHTTRITNLGPDQNVRAGLQRVIQQFVTNSANVFLLDLVPVPGREAEHGMELTAQVGICKKVINAYRFVIQNHYMEQQTWNQMLVVLLKITSGVLNQNRPCHKENTLGGKLAHPLLQTLIVTWIKANIHVHVTSELWDHFFAVLSSLTGCLQLVQEWAKHMETLTRVLARHVYDLDLNDLPLDRLSELKSKRRRGRQPHNNEDHKRTFARGLSRNDPVEILRAQMRSRGDPDVSQTGCQGLVVSESAPAVRTTQVGASKDDAFAHVNRPRALSGEVSPLSMSQSHLITETLPTPGHMVRSNSDSSLMVDLEKTGSSDLLAEDAGDRRSLTEHVLSHLELASSTADNGDRVSLASNPAVDNVSVASADSSVPYQIIDTTDSNSASFDKSSLRSDTESLLKYQNGSRNSSVGRHMSGPSETSPTQYVTSNDDNEGTLADNEDEDGDQHGSEIRGQRTKDSPTPDRESIHIEDMNAVPSKGVGSKLAATREEDNRSVVVGGNLPGWTPVSAVVLWRRMLGCLGDINKISDPEIHEQVFEYLCDLVDLMLKMRDNQGVTKDNQSSPPPPVYIPPILYFSGWIFEAVNLPKQYKSGTLQAYRLLCASHVCKHDIPLSDDQLARFYTVLHQGLVSQDQDVVNVLIKHCGTRIFSLPLRGATALVLDFVQAANSIIAATELKDAPRSEAMSLLGSLLCLPTHLKQIPTLQPNGRDLVLIQCTDLKDHVVNMLLRAGKREPAGLARCIAISSLGIYICEELSHNTQHSKIKEAIQTLLATLRASDKSVAQVATNTLAMLYDHIPTLLETYPQLPHKIIQEIAKAIYILLLSMDNPSPEKSKRLLVSTMFCLLDWCMKVPLSVLLETTQGNSCLIHLVFKVLHIVLCGPQGLSSQQHRTLRSEFINQEDDIHDSPPSRVGTAKSVLESLPDYTSRGQRGLSPVHYTDADYAGKTENTLQLAAKTVLSHLVNHLGHFPMSSGASQLNTCVQEHHDLTDPVMEELSAEIFNAPNVQFFVLNNTTLLTLVEVPAQTNVPGGGVTVGLTTARTLTRAVIRDTAGKFCWDSSVLYGPPHCRAGSFPSGDYVSLNEEPQITVDYVEDIDLIGQDSTSMTTTDSQCASEEGSMNIDEMPNFGILRPDQDALDQLLHYIGQTSPECQLTPGEPLNVPFPCPEQIAASTESAIINSVLKQKEDEQAFYSQHQNDAGMVAHPMYPMDNIDVSSPFHLCRLFLNQLGFLQWEKRLHFDLLKKSEKLLRELKHIDSQRCRETHKIAVIYVAPGQEDKQSILSNTGGSLMYEQFVAGLGWEVELESHQGFMGGLQSNGSTGTTAPYYATSTQEVIYHVATRMPSEHDDDIHRKLRHLGNDEVQIIWSEHSRAYRRGIIPTEFGDVLIIIYPLENGLFRIQINRKPEVPYIGPLFDGAIIDHRILPGLVRATAITAGRILRLQKPYYKSFYEERASCVEEIVRQHKELTMFEEFAAQVFSPVQPQGDPLGSQVSLSEPLSVQTSQFYSSLCSDSDSMHSRASTGKVSPHTAKTKAENSFQRRLSFGKSKKSVSKQAQLQMAAQSSNPVAAPDSPSVVKCKK